MPMLKIHINTPLDAEAGQALVAEASRIVGTLLGKPERYVMVSLISSATMAFGGDASPLAYLELKSIGLPKDRTTALSKALCAFVNSALGIHPDRVYIEFSESQGSMWGWNGGTF